MILFNKKLQNAFKNDILIKKNDYNIIKFNIYI